MKLLWIVFFLSMSATWAASFYDELHRKDCYAHLSKFRDLFCNFWEYYEETPENFITHETRPTTRKPRVNGIKTARPHRRSARSADMQLLTTCCTKPCSLDELLSYC